MNVKKEVLEKYPSSYFNTLMSSQPTKRVCTVYYISFYSSYFYYYFALYTNMSNRYETEKDEKEDLKYAEVIVKAMEGKEISFDHFESEPVLITQKLKDYNVQVPIVFSKSFDVSFYYFVIFCCIFLMNRSGHLMRTILLRQVFVA